MFIIHHFNIHKYTCFFLLWFGNCLVQINACFGQVFWKNVMFDWEYKIQMFWMKSIQNCYAGCMKWTVFLRHKKRGKQGCTLNSGRDIEWRYTSRLAKSLNDHLTLQLYNAYIAWVRWLQTTLNKTHKQKSK